LTSQEKGRTKIWLNGIKNLEITEKTSLV